MEFQFLGTGSAFTVGNDNYNSNMLITAPSGKRLLIDCGSDCRHALAKLGLSYHHLSDVYISHLHADHCGGMEWLGFSTKFDPNCEKLTLYINEQLATDLWQHALSGGMSSLDDEHATLQSYFNVHPLREQGSFHWQGLKLTLVRTIHTHNKDELIPSFGLFIESENTNIFLTTDTQFSPENLMKHYEAADIIFHDCETTSGKSGVHAHYTDLVTLPEDLKQKIWLYHYSPGELPDAQADGFQGFVKPRQIFTF